MREVGGFSRAAAERIVAARADRPFAGLNDLIARARLDRGERDALIGAGAVARIGGHRRQAHWRAQAIEDPRPLLRVDEEPLLDDGVALAPAGAMEEMRADYRSTGLTLGPHPLALLRGREPFRRCTTAERLASLPGGRFVRVAGLVTGRQRPGTASGVLFLTLEDETGNVNVVVWRNHQEHFRRALLGASLLLVKGVMESRDGVVHVIGGEFLDHSAALAGLETRSRDFH